MLERLVAAIRSGDLATMRALLQEGAPVNGLDPSTAFPVTHYTMLTLATAMKNREAVALLLQHGADPNWKEGTAFNALVTAAVGDLLDIARMLLEHGAVVGRAILYVDSPEMIDLLVAHGGEVNPPAHEGTTPLHMVVFKENCDVLIPKLLSYGANINAKDRDGFTPLTFGITDEGGEKGVGVLVDYGADLSPESLTFGTMGSTPVEEVIAGFEELGRVDIANKIRRRLKLEPQIE